MGISNEDLRIKDFLIYKEDCIEKVKQGAFLFAEEDIAHALPAGVYSSLSRYVLDFVTSSYDHAGDVFLPDQVDPEKLTAHIESTKHPDVDHDVLYALVCRKQQKAINAFYKTMKESEGVPMRTFFVDGIDTKKVRREYADLYLKRKNENPKMIRSASKITKRTPSNEKAQINVFLTRNV